MRGTSTWVRVVVAMWLGVGAGCDAPLAAGGEEAEADVEQHIEALCVDYCPRRIACVRDGWAGGSVQECVRQCGEPRLYERGGEPSEELIAQLECLAELSCEELPLEVRTGEACAAESVDFGSAGLVEE